LNVVGSLTGPELDDAKVSETVFVKRIFPDDGFDFPSTLAHGQDDPAVSRDFSTRDEEVAGSVVFPQETDVSGHVHINLAEVALVREFDDEHSDRVCMRTHRGVKDEKVDSRRLPTREQIGWWLLVVHSKAPLCDVD
jgi:hypothetical protein